MKLSSLVSVINAVFSIYFVYLCGVRDGTKAFILTIFLIVYIISSSFVNEFYGKKRIF
jgi:hypothetical protein